MLPSPDRGLFGYVLSGSGCISVRVWQLAHLMVGEIKDDADAEQVKHPCLTTSAVAFPLV